MWTRTAKLNRRAAFYLVTAGVLCAAPIATLCQQNTPIVQAGIGDLDQQQTRQAALPTVGNLAAVPEGFEGLRLSPGYLLSMSIYGVPEMSAELRVDAQGFVTVPLIGGVRVDGDTLPQAQDRIAKVLEEKEILKNPQVLLNVLQYASRNVSVLGEVHSPGRIQLLAPQALGDVIALAGGESIAAGGDIEIQRTGPNGKQVSQHVEYIQGRDPAVLRRVMVEPGDTVLVHRAGIIYVLGAVNRPGGYLMVDGGSLNVVQAISLASGTTLQASTKWAMVVRRKGDGYVQFKIPLSKMETGAATPAQLEWNDVLYVPVSGWKVTLINGSNVLSAATSAAIYQIR